MNEEWNNPMYRFIDTTKKTEYIPEWVPTSAMFYDGILLDQAIEGYQTLVVSGREMLNVNIESTQIQMGSLITNQTTPARILTVKYKLEDKNPEKVQERFDELKRFLYRTKDVPIQFNDELGFTYYGRFNTADEIPGDSNTAVSSYTIFCANPLKYSALKTSSGKIATYTPYPQPPENIRVTLDRDTSVQVSNGRETISITGAAIYKGDVVEFRIREGNVLVNGQDKTRILDLTSDFKNFLIKNGDNITTNNGTIEIEYKVAKR